MMGANEGEAVLGDSLIPLVNKLQDIFSQVTVDLKLDLPQVAVVGSQSSGKSSVLEALVGRDFLPRGKEIVTRRPLVLQLVKTTGHGHGPAGSKSNEWGEFLHAPGKVFTDFDLIRQEVQQETDRLVGSNKNVSDKPIRLKIFSPRVLTMTLVDLPGLTRVPVGDQPTNIEAKIREMALDYIRRPNCIILAVSPANSDLATSDALQLAQVADPEGHRTIGVLTKLDIMDRGTDASHILRNAHIPLRMGYVGLVLRCQEDINKNTPMADSRKAEEAFFAARAEYRDVSAHCGTGVLARRLNSILVDHIRGLLPGLRRKIHEALDARNAELHALGDPEPMQSRSAKGGYLLQLLCDYAERYAAMVDGRHLDLTTATQLSGGARVREVFTEHLTPALLRLEPARDMTDAEIFTVIRNGAGVSGSLLVPHEPFELLARRAIAQLLNPALSCKERVHEELVRIAEQACPQEATRFPVLLRHLAAAVLDYIRNGAQPAEAMIRSLIDCECDYINCDHPEFVGGRAALRATLERSSRAGPATSGLPNGYPRRENGEVNGNGMMAGSAPPPHMPRIKSAGAAHENGKGMGAVVGLKNLPDSAPLGDGVLLPAGARGSANDGMLMGDGSGSLSAQNSGLGSSSYSGGGPGGGSSWFSWFRSDRADGGAGASSSSSMMGNGQRAEDGLASGLGLPPSVPRMRQGMGGGSRVRLTENEASEVDMVRGLVDSYFAIVRKTVADQVPKAIMHFMVHFTKRGLQQHLIKALYRDDMLEELLAEADDVVARRNTAREAVAALRAAVAALEEVPQEMALGAAAAAGGSSAAFAAAAAEMATSGGSTHNAPGGGAGGGHGSSSSSAFAIPGMGGSSAMPPAPLGLLSQGMGGSTMGSGSNAAGASASYANPAATYHPSPGPGITYTVDHRMVGGAANSNVGLDRHPSMVAAAKVAASAAAQLQPSSTFGLDVHA